MPGHHYTHEEYSLRQVVRSFGDLLFQLEVLHLTYTDHVVYQFCELENIGYLVLRYLNTGALPYEEFSKDWLFDRED
jgi:hypothetical protein